MEREGNALDRLASEFKELYEKYSEALESRDLDRALEIGVEIMEDLLEAAQSVVLPAIVNPRVREIAVNILGHHERALAYVKGAREAVRDAPSEYTVKAKERAAETLSAGINSLFGFILGVLVALTDLELTSMPLEGGYPSRSPNDVPRVL